MHYRAIAIGRADRDLLGIARWLRKRSPLGARRWLLAVEEAKEKLSHDPMSYGLAPEDGFASKVWRWLKQKENKEARKAGKGDLTSPAFLVSL